MIADLFPGPRFSSVPSLSGEPPLNSTVNGYASGHVRFDPGARFDHRVVPQPEKPAAMGWASAPWVSSGRW